MITSIPDLSVAPDLFDELLRIDYAFSGTIVLEPFPDASLRDLLAELHAQLAVSPVISPEHIKRGTALKPLTQSAVRTLVILGADALAKTTLTDFTSLRDIDRLDELILVTSATHHIHEGLVHPRQPIDTAKLLTALARDYCEPAIPTLPLAISHSDLSDTQIAAIATLAQRAGHTLGLFRGTQTRLAILAAGLQLFDRHRSHPGTILRLHALDVALHERGFRLHPEHFTDAVAHCRQRTQLDLWLPGAVDPAQPRAVVTPLDEPLPRPLPMTAETTAAWLGGFQQARTHKVYARAIDLFCDWRRTNAVDAADRDIAHLEDWAFDRLRSGAGPRTVEVQYAAARRHHLYLLTGQHDAIAQPQPRGGHRRSPPRALPARLRARLTSPPGRPATDNAINLLSRRRYRPPLESPNAHRFLELFDHDEERAAARIDELRLPASLWLEVQPLLGPVAHQREAERMTGCLNAILLVLGTALTWPALPLELGYGSGNRAYRYLRQWVREGRWPAVRRKLEEHGPAYRGLAWDRVSPSRTRDA